MIVMLKNKRIGFPAFAEKQSVGDGEPAYGGRLILEPTDSEGIKQIEDAMLAAAKVRWKDDAEAVLAFLKEEDKVAFSRKEYRNKKTMKVYGGFEGKFHLGMRAAKNQPTVFNQYGEPVTDKAKIAALVYSGCYVNAKVEFWAQDNNFGRRINCTPLGIMFAADGESFGGGTAPASADDDDFAKLAKAKASAESAMGEGLV